MTTAFHRRSSPSLVHELLALMLASALFVPVRSETTTVLDSAKLEGRPVRTIIFAGKYRLRQVILRNEIDSRPGALFNWKRLSRDRRKIEGLGIFASTRADAAAAGDSVDIRFHLQEVWTLLPLASIGSTDGRLDWSIGLSERNLLGYYLQAAILYRRYENRNSGYLTLSWLRAFGEDIAVTVAMSRRREVEPLTFRAGSGDFDYLNKTLALGVGRRLHERLYASLSGGYSRENWSLLGAPAAGLPTTIDYPRYFVAGAVSIGRVYYEHFFYDGWDMGQDLAVINERPQGNWDKWRHVASFRLYRIFGFTNLAVRLQAQTSSADERVQPFAVSGDFNIRGYRSEIERGDHLLFGNIEWRQRVLDRKVLYVQTAMFIDGGFIWGRFRRASDAAHHPYWSVGGGLRGSIKQFLGRVGRLDLAFSPRDGDWSVYLATSQFF